MLEIIGQHYTFIVLGAAALFASTLAFASLTDRDPTPPVA